MRIITLNRFSGLLFGCALVATACSNSGTLTSPAKPLPQQDPLQTPVPNPQQPVGDRESPYVEGAPVPEVDKRNIAMNFNSFLFPVKVTGFEDHAHLQQSFYLAEDGQSWNVSSLPGSAEFNVEAGIAYKVAPECKTTSQSTAFTSGGKTYAKPFLVGMGTICFQNDAAKTITRVASYASPRDSFSVAYFGQTSTEAYFLQNSKPTRDGVDDGLLTLIAVSLADKTVSLRTLLTDYPGFSGAMSLDLAAQKFWITSGVGNSTNDIFELATSTLSELIASAQTKKFLDVTTPKFSNVPGMSFAVSVTGNSLFYNNASLGFPGIPSYKVDKETGVTSSFENTCEPIVGKDLQFLGLCEGTSLVVIP